MKGFCDTTCPRCRSKIGWVGNAANRPACAKCGHRPPQAELDAEDAQLRAAIEQMDREQEEARQRMIDRADPSEVIAYLRGWEWPGHLVGGVGPLLSCESPYLPVPRGVTDEQRKAVLRLHRRWMDGAYDRAQGREWPWSQRPDELAIWTVYRKPKDRPDAPYLARLYHGERPTPEVLTASDIDTLRAELPPGLVRMERSPGDDPCIIEVWL